MIHRNCKIRPVWEDFGEGNLFVDESLGIQNQERDRSTQVIQTNAMSFMKMMRAMQDPIVKEHVAKAIETRIENVAMRENR